MTQIAEVILNPRQERGTGAARSVRREEKVPGILYGGKQEPTLVSVEKRWLIKEMHQPGLMNKLFEVKGTKKKELVLIRDIQLHPVKDLPIHIDFMRVDEKKEIHLSIPLHFINEDKSQGIKRGGVLSVIHQSLEVVCLAKKIPDNIVVDLEKAGVGFALHQSDIVLPEGVRFAHPDRQETLATIVPPKIKGEEENSEEEKPENSEE